MFVRYHVLLDQCSPTVTDPEIAKRSLLAQPSMDGLIKRGALGVSSVQLTKVVILLVIFLLLSSRIIRMLLTAQK